MRVSVLIWLGISLYWNSFADLADDDIPDMELLEFLAEWQSDGEPIDPRFFEHDRRIPGQKLGGEEADAGD